MGRIDTPQPVKLICPVIYTSSQSRENILSILEYNFGKIDYVSSDTVFDYTDYYNDEMGENLKRFFAGFEPLIDPEDIVDMKIRTNQLEQKWSCPETGARRVNIDPGYIESSKLILASTKNFSHRIYLRKGIYAEVTLIYQNKGFIDLPWTYPDYRTEWYKQVFLKIRAIYQKQLHEL